MILAINHKTDEIRNIKCLAIRRMPYRDSYVVGQFIVDYFVEDENKKLREYRQEINTGSGKIVFIGFVEKIPKKENYSSEELVYWEEE